jgi:DNA replication protein DnaC
VHRLVAEGRAAGIAVPQTPPTAFELASGIVWTTARALVMARRSCGFEEPELLERCRAATLLVVDEWGSEAHDRDGDLMGVVDERYSYSLPTIITTGMESAAFEQRYGEHVLRRVSETGIKIEEF